MEKRRCTSCVEVALLGGAALIVALSLAMLPTQAWATHVCADAAANPTRDTDGDGLTDDQECRGITTVKPKGGTAASFLRWDGSPDTRQSRVDPDTKDVFICVTKTSSSLLDQVSTTGDFLNNELVSMLPAYSSLGVTAHVLLPGQSASDRTFVSSPAYPSGVTPEKCIRVAESLDPNGTILGSCNWGTPQGLDGCGVFTQRIKNHVESVCNSAGDPDPAKRVQFRRELSLWVIRHESGHSHGGLTRDYVASNGGYHYACGAGSTMEQCVPYDTRGGVCSWAIPSGWNTTLDPPSVKLK